MSVVAADGSVAAESAYFAMYTARTLRDVHLSHVLLIKGETYHVNWTATGEPFR